MKQTFLRKLIKGVGIVTVGVCLTGMATFSSCSILNRFTTPSVIGIELTSETNEGSFYTVYFSDGSTSTLTVKNGANGKDGQNAPIDIEDAYQKYVQEYGEISYREFLSLFLKAENTADISPYINQSLLSVAQITCNFKEQYDSGLMSEFSPTYTDALYSGSAVIYQMDQDYTYFLTNYHVVYDPNSVQDKICSEIRCYLYGSGSEGDITLSGTNGASYIQGNPYEVKDYGPYALIAEYVGGSSTYDLALVRIATSAVLNRNPSACPVTLASDYHVGQTAYAVGNPASDGISVTQGIVSKYSKYINLSVTETTQSYRAVCFDTPIYAGSSGGGLFNDKGELIAITEGGDGEERQNVNYGVPLPVIRSVANSIITYAKDSSPDTNDVYKILVGVTVQEQNGRYVYNEALGYGREQAEITVTEISSDSKASYMGLTEGDILTALNIDGVTYSLFKNYDISDALLNVREGSSVSFSYTRNGIKKTSLSYTVQAEDLIKVA